MSSIHGDTLEMKKDVLKAALDKRTFSCNHSPTGQARVIWVKGNVAELEVVAHPESYMQKYNSQYHFRIGTKFNLPVQYAWNAIYY